MWGVYIKLYYKHVYVNSNNWSFLESLKSVLRQDTISEEVGMHIKHYHWNSHITHRHWCSRFWESFSSSHYTPICAPIAELRLANSHLFVKLGVAIMKNCTGYKRYKMCCYEGWLWYKGFEGSTFWPFYNKTNTWNISTFLRSLVHTGLMSDGVSRVCQQIPWVSFWWCCILLIDLLAIDVIKFVYSFILVHIDVDIIKISHKVCCQTLETPAPFFKYLYLSNCDELMNDCNQYYLFWSLCDLNSYYWDSVLPLNATMFFLIPLILFVV